MTATVVSDPPSATVAFDGEIDISNCPAIRRFLMAAIDGGNVQLAVDMSGVTFIDAAGIGVLVAAANRARAAGGGLSLLAPSPRVQRLLDILHLDPLRPLASDRTVALPERDPGHFPHHRILGWLVPYLSRISGGLPGGRCE
jgi:anti-sigma B factor antagonist